MRSNNDDIVLWASTFLDEEAKKIILTSHTSLQFFSVVQKIILLTRVRYGDCWECARAQESRNWRIFRLRENCLFEMRVCATPHNMRNNNSDVFMRAALNNTWKFTIKIIKNNTSYFNNHNHHRYSLVSSSSFIAIVYCSLHFFYFYASQPTKSTVENKNTLVILQSSLLLTKFQSV